MELIDSNDLVFNNDKEHGIMSGGFSVNSILMKNRTSPIVTLNSNNLQTGGKNVSDIFNDLVVPNWALYHPNLFSKNSVLTHDKNEENSSSESDDDVLDDNLHETLLEIITQQENHKIYRKKHTKREKTTNANKKTKKNKNKILKK